MNKLKSFFILFICISAFPAYGNERPKMDSIIGKEFFVEDARSGQSFRFAKKEGNLFVMWRIHGSGVPIISEKEYKVNKQSDWQYSFDLNGNEVLVGIFDNGEVKAFLNGIRIYIADSNIPVDAR